ncbi:MAG TPA: hypothetical protein VFM08_03840 [Nocardioides sp.]|jgi:hypothetical protein|nr:hypothetical protein [Nocardioides sp.]
MRPTPGHARSGLGTALAVVLLGGALAVATAPSAVAAPAPACPAKSLTKQINQADVVFRGMVDRAGRPHGKGDQRTRTYAVTADRVYQSSLVTDRVRVTAEVGTRCAPPTLKEGKRYIFFVTEQGSRLVSTPATARATHQLTSRVEAKLGSGKAPSTPPPADPEFQKVADAAPPELSRLLAPGAALVVLSLLGLFVVSRVSRRTT